MLMLRNKDKLIWGNGAEWVYTREKSRVFHQILPSLMRMGAENEKRPQQVVSHRAGDESIRLDMQERRESKDLIFA